jgi:hypothetical protein
MGQRQEARQRRLRRLVGDEPVDPFRPADLQERIAVELARIGEHGDGARRQWRIPIRQLESGKRCYNPVVSTTRKRALPFIICS